VIEEVEEFAAELETEALANREVLVKTQVEIIECWSENGVAACIPVPSSGNCRIRTLLAVICAILRHFADGVMTIRWMSDHKSVRAAIGVAATYLSSEA
jgi:hypothetical protein